MCERIGNSEADFVVILATQAPNTGGHLVMW
jgi:hypothetical protein